MKNALQEIRELEEKKIERFLSVLKEFLALILPQQKKLQPTSTLMGLS